MATVRTYILRANRFKWYVMLAAIPVGVILRFHDGHGHPRDIVWAGGLGLLIATYLVLTGPWFTRLRDRRRHR